MMSPKSGLFKTIRFYSSGCRNMCDGKHSSKRDVVILSIKPKRPEYPSSQKVVPVCELLQEWDKLDAYYRGQLLKLTKSLSKSSSNKLSSKASRPSVTPNTLNSRFNKLNNKSSSPVNKKHSSSLSSDQFHELFGDENLFNHHHVPHADNNNNRQSQKSNKLLHSRSLNSLFEDDSLDNNGLSQPPRNNNSNSRKSSLANVNNLVVSIPVISVRNNGDTNFDKHKYTSDYDEDDDESCVSEVEEEQENFLSVPRDNFQVQYGTKQKTRVTLLETGNVSPKRIVPIHVTPYKPPTAQGLNGVHIQKILYHKNDKVNYASPTTTSARTPDKPPDNTDNKIHLPPGPIKSIKATNSNSPVSTVSPRSISSGSSNNGSPPGENSNNNATPKQTSSPELSPPKSDQGNLNKAWLSHGKSNSPSINSTHSMKLKRPTSLNTDGNSNGYANGKRSRHGGDVSTDHSPNGFPVTSSTGSTYSLSSSSSSSCGDNDYQFDENLSPKRNTMGGDSTSNSFKKSSNNVVKKPPVFLKPVTIAGGDSSGSAVFVPPPAVSITDRIIKKASRPQPELIERQKRRRQESDRRKSYAMQKGDEHEERESIDLSMKSFEMIWNVPLLSPLRSP